MLFFGEAERHERRERRSRIIDSNAAINGKDGGKALLRDLGGGEE